MNAEHGLVEGELFDDTPLMLGETLGWRAWVVIAETSRAPRLRSATHSSTVWPTNRWTAATCGGELHCRQDDGGDRRIPGEHCRCGLYAARDLEQLLGLGYASWGGRDTVVVGQVAFAGKVIPGTQGWRAERGRIARLYVPFSKAELGKRLSEVYAVPVEFAAWWATDPRLGIAKARV
jgi:hypothetical protein